MTPRNRRLGVACALVVLALDQGSKALARASAGMLTGGVEVLPFLDLTLVRNPGVSFGLLGMAPWWGLSALGLMIAGALAVWLWRAQSRWLAAGLGLVIGGAVGNVVDRLRHRAVTDFLDFHLAGRHWPAFNLADTAIFVGIALLVLSYWRPRRSAAQSERHIAAPDVSETFTPALGRPEWTGLYDVALRLFTRERRWRAAMMEQIAPQAGQVILDVGCGTGTLAIAIKQAAPDAVMVGLDPDPTALVVAAAKADKAGQAIEWRRGFARDAAAPGEACFDIVVSSLVFHQAPMNEKRLGLLAMRTALKQGGRLVIADYGAQRSWLMRTLFRTTVQRLDGRDNTQPNADGILARLIAEAGFGDVVEVETIPTPSGSISLLIAAAHNSTRSDDPRLYAGLMLPEVT